MKENTSLLTICATRSLPWSGRGINNGLPYIQLGKDFIGEEEKWTKEEEEKWKQRKREQRKHLGRGWDRFLLWTGFVTVGGRGLLTRRRQNLALLADGIAEGVDICAELDNLPQEIR